MLKRLVFLVMLAVWNRYDEHIEEAARDLGANWFRSFREVIVPQTMPVQVACRSGRKTAVVISG